MEESICSVVKNVGENLNIEENVEDLKLRNYLSELGKTEITVTLGTTPTGPLHIANVYTMINGMYRVNRVCQSLGIMPTFIVGYNDSESAATHRESEKIHADQVLNHTLGELVASRREGLVDLMGAISQEFNISYKVSDFSDLQKEDGLRALLPKMKDDFGEGSDKHPIYIAHDECGYRTPVHDYLNTKGAKVKCQNCKETLIESEVDFKNKDVEFAFDLNGIMVLRDTYYNADVHIFGGDFKQCPDISYPKALGSKPFQYHTGLVLGTDNHPMHVSEDNAVNWSKFLNDKKTLYKIVELGNDVSRPVKLNDYQKLIKK